MKLHLYTIAETHYPFLITKSSLMLVYNVNFSKEMYGLNTVNLLDDEGDLSWWFEYRLNLIGEL